MKVLLIAADATLRENLPFVLREAGPFEVLLARDGREAAWVAQQQRVDVAIVDLYAPGRAGLGTLREARAALPGIPLAAVAMRTYAEYRTACLASGADSFMDKSGELQDLVRVVRLLGCAGAGEQRVKDGE